jgi:hypothetical protein
LCRGRPSGRRAGRKSGLYIGEVHNPSRLPAKDVLVSRARSFCVRLFLAEALAVARPAPLPRPASPHGFRGIGIGLAAATQAPRRFVRPSIRQSAFRVVSAWLNGSENFRSGGTSPGVRQNTLWSRGKRGLCVPHAWSGRAVKKTRTLPRSEPPITSWRTKPAPPAEKSERS